MRFRINLSIDKAKWGNTLPFSYQYELSSYIYHTLAGGNEAYAQWLHANGYRVEGKQFRLFVFSPLLLSKVSIDKQDNRLRLLDDTAWLQISFLPEQSTREFVSGVFREQQFTLGDRQSKVQFTVKEIEMLPSPVFNTEIVGTTLSPLCLSRKNAEGGINYYSAADPDAGRAIFNNLKNKYEAFYGTPFSGSPDFEWQTLTEPRTKLITIKAGTPQETRIRGSLCRFRLKADNELLRIAYETGLGEKNSTGFGMIEGLRD